MIFIEHETSKKIFLSEEQDISDDIIIKIIETVLDYASCPYETEVNVILTDNTGIHVMNKTHRGIDAPTDVLSFPLIDFTIAGDLSHVENQVYDYFNADTGELMLGDIVISIDKVLEQAENYGHSKERELAFLTAHSMLHLLGYDHEKEDERLKMEEIQKEILKIGFLPDKKRSTK